MTKVIYKLLKGKFDKTSLGLSVNMPARGWIVQAFDARGKILPIPECADYVTKGFAICSAHCLIPHDAVEGINTRAVDANTDAITGDAWVSVFVSQEED